MIPDFQSPAQAAPAAASPADSASRGQPQGCPGCGVSVRMKAGELERVIEEYFRDHRPELCGDAEAESRLAICGSCPDLQYGSTCRHCGCLVEVRARLRDYSCPSPSPRW